MRAQSPHSPVTRSSSRRRVSSPAISTFSGISSYRTDSYRSLRDRSLNSSETVDSYQVARAHYDELSRYLATYLAKEPANSRSTARQKLTRLTQQQFQELSTDIYDEVIRRKTNSDNNQVHFLPPREEFHPKRNQARQKLATHPINRFKGLSSNVYHELVRRYPGLKEEPSGICVTRRDFTTDEDFPAPDFPISPRDRDSQPPTPTRFSRDRGRSPSGEIMDYEFRIATMQRRIDILEREIDDGAVRERQHVQQLQNELHNCHRRADQQSVVIQNLQRELANVHEEARRSREQDARRAKQDEEDIQALVDLCKRLKQELAAATDSDRLRSDTEGFSSELSDCSRRNDDLVTSKDADFIIARNQMNEWKYSHEQSKAELLSVNATSPPLLQRQRFGKQLPVSANGVIPDVHLTAFLTNINAFLSAGRSNSPIRVLSPMKSVVNSVTNILGDVRSNSRRHSDPEGVHALEQRVEATLSNLVAASENHATSAGLSPVDLLDTAARRVSAAVTDLGRVVLLRHATKAEQEMFAPASVGTATRSTPGPRTAEVQPSVAYQRDTNEGSWRQDEWEPVSDEQELTHSGLRYNDNPGPQDAWTELRPYLEEQTVSIAYALQGVISGVESSTPSPTLDENLTQIILIVASIVAVCHDGIPASQWQQGYDILRELSEHANKFIEMRALAEVTNESRQVMKESSLAIANAMKMLHSL